MPSDLDRRRTRPQKSRRVVWLRRAALLALSAVVARTIFGLVGRIDWDAVWRGVEQVGVWQFAFLVALVVVRQILNAMPQVFFIDGLSVFRATGTDLGSTLVATLGPPGTGPVFRVLMLRSWRIEVDRAAAGSTSNTLMFNIARWVSPLLGVVLLIGVRFDAAYAGTAAVGLLIASGIFVVALLVTRSQALAKRIGRGAGNVARRVRASVDPERWASSVAGFQTQMATRFRRGALLSLLALTGMLLVDAGIALLAMRFVGIGQAQLSWVEIMAGFLVVFPLTLFPFQGLGLLDAALVADMTSVGGVRLEAALVAALLSYRVVTLGIPAILGALFLVSWRHTRRQSEAPPPAQ